MDGVWTNGRGFDEWTNGRGLDEWTNGRGLDEWTNGRGLDDRSNIQDIKRSFVHSSENDVDSSVRLTFSDAMTNVQAINRSFVHSSENDVDSSDWRPITDRDLNALTVDQLLAGGQSWSYGMRLCIDSSRVESFDPVKDYLDHLPA